MAQSGRTRQGPLLCNCPNGPNFARGGVKLKCRFYFSFCSWVTSQELCHDIFIASFAHVDKFLFYSNSLLDRHLLFCKETVQRIGPVVRAFGFQGFLRRVDEQRIFVVVDSESDDQKEDRDDADQEAIFDLRIVLFDEKVDGKQPHYGAEDRLVFLLKGDLLELPQMLGGKLADLPDVCFCSLGRPCRVLTTCSLPPAIARKQGMKGLSFGSLEGKWRDISGVL